MCALLAILFTVVPAIELFLLLKIGERIGASTTLALILFTGLLGATLSRIGGCKTLRQIQQDLHEVIMPGRKFLDGLLILIGAVLLITPGVVTDLVGLLMIFPGTRVLFRELLVRTLKRKFMAHTGIVEIDPRSVYVSNDDIHHSR